MERRISTISKTYSNGMQTLKDVSLTIPPPRVVGRERDGRFHDGFLDSVLVLIRSEVLAP